MLGFDLEITLQECGAFVVPNAGAAQSDIRITFDSERLNRSWVGSAAADGGWHPAAAFERLDEALEWAVRASTGRSGVRFKVNLPCGASFSRPGRVPAEDVMSSLDWVYVTHLIGFVCLTTDNPCTEPYARRRFLGMISANPDVELGEATPVDGDMRFWVGDLHIPFEGFIRVQDIKAEKEVCFAAEGIETIEGYDCRKAGSGESRSAEIISFVDHAASRQLQAA